MRLCVLHRFSMTAFELMYIVFCERLPWRIGIRFTLCPMKQLALLIPFQNMYVHLLSILGTRLCQTLRSRTLLHTDPFDQLYRLYAISKHFLPGILRLHTFTVWGTLPLS